MKTATKPGMSEAAVLAEIKQKAGILFDVELDRQNTGGAYNASGQYVSYGKAGNSDLTGMTGPSWGRLAGLKLDIECKAEFWRPPRPPRAGRLPGKLRKRWEAQLHRIRTTNANGGFGFWTDHSSHCFEVLKLLKTGGYRIVIDRHEEVSLVPID